MATGPCSVEGCETAIHCRRLCKKHYCRLQAHGDTSVNLKPGGRICAVDDCDRPYHGKGYCMMHASRVARTGSPFIVRESNGVPRIENPGYIAVHARMSRANPKTGVCADCGAERKTHMALMPGRGDRSDVTGGAAGLRYSIDPADYRELCHSCHKLMDNAVRKAAA